MVADMQNQFALADRLYDSASIDPPGRLCGLHQAGALRFRAGDYAGAIQSARTAYLSARIRSTR